jgi:hypothetical protein
MKSTEVYAILKSRIAGELKSLGFKREKSFLSWSRQHGDLYTVLWCQVSQDGWDEYAGSRFTVEIQRSAESVVGSVTQQRKRIGKLLSRTQREEIRHIQNDVIANLQRPLKNHPFLAVSPDASKWYLAKFEQDETPYPENHDIWFRYARAADVERWAAYLVKVIPECVELMERSNGSTVH